MGATTAACSAEVVPHLVIKSASQKRKGQQLNKMNKREGMGSIGWGDAMKEAKENPARLRVPDGYYSASNENESKALLEGEEHEDDSTDATISPEEISAMILKKLFQAVENGSHRGEKITRAVVGVPAYFNDMQRDATIKVSYENGCECTLQIECHRYLTL